jgi:hypothetical protein
MARREYEAGQKRAAAKAREEAEANARLLQQGLDLGPSQPKQSREEELEDVKNGARRYFCREYQGIEAVVDCGHDPPINNRSRAILRMDNAKSGNLLRTTLTLAVSTQRYRT